jgi:hypothetical protein
MGSVLLTQRFDGAASRACSAEVRGMRLARQRSPACADCEALVTDNVLT